MDGFIGIITALLAPQRSGYKMLLSF